MKIVVLRNGARGEAVCEALRDEHDLLSFPVAPVNSSGFAEMLTEWEPDLGVCAGYPVILRERVLGVPKHGWWNCHAGPVPEYRGGSPLNWQIIDGEEHIGITLMVMDDGIDTGPVISRKRFNLSQRQTIKDAHEIANDLFPKMVKAALDNFDNLTPLQQAHSDLVRGQRNDEMGEINMNWPNDKIVNFVRALTRPYPGAWIWSDGAKLRIWSVSVD